MVAPSTKAPGETPDGGPVPPRRPRSRALTRSSSSATPSVKTLTARLLAAVRVHYPAADLTGVERAVATAIEAHGTQQRASGEPYVTHPIASAHILAELGLDTSAIQAALLHDVPEDTEYSLTDVEDRFGP